jgi:PAS domain S-box-containing protein
VRWTLDAPRQALEMLFAQDLQGVFFMTLDEPISWSDPADHDRLLEYALDHLRVTAVNDAMCIQYNQRREDLLGSPPRARWGADPTAWKEHMRPLYNQGHVYHTLRAPRADGSWYHVEGHYVCMYDDAGRITGHAGIQRDVTDRRHATLELATSRDRLAASERLAALGTFAAHVGHDINNPLTFIKLNLELVTRELAAGRVDPDKVRAMVDHAREGVDRASAVVRELQALAAILAE